MLIAYTTSGYTYSGSVGRQNPPQVILGSLHERRKEPVKQSARHREHQPQLHNLVIGSPLQHRGFLFGIQRKCAVDIHRPGGTPVPLPVINPAAVVFFNGKSYAAGLGANPVRGLTLSATFAKALSSTEQHSEFEQ